MSSATSPLPQTNDSLMWVSAMMGAYAAMPEAERAELCRWEAENTGFDDVATSDWPGWRRYLGPPPWECAPFFAPAKPKGELPAGGYVYVLSGGGYYKIGRSKNFDQRLKALSIQLPYSVEPVSVIRCADARRAEKWLHDAFEHKRLNGEWFDLNEDDLRFIDRSASFLRGGES